MTRPFPNQRFFYLFIILHFIAWTLAPILVRYNLPMDSLEGAMWGHQLDLGYDKNPFLNGWLTSLAVYLGGSSGWMIYLFSQMSVCVCFWAVWSLAKQILPPVYAVIAVLLLEGCQYYHLHAIDFNDNNLELGLWALTIYFFYQSLKNPSRGSWLLTGLFAGLSMMAKYYVLALLAPMALLLFLDENNRKQLKTPLPYFGLGLFLLIIAPHTIWLFFHDFITVTYVFERTASLPHWYNHFLFPTQFAFEQIVTFLPACLMCGLLFINKKPFFSENRFQLSPFNYSFLIWVGLGPFIVTLLLSLVFGLKLHAAWGMPLESLWGILLITLIQPRMTKINYYAFLSGTIILMGMFLTGYSLSVIYFKNNSSANFPGKEIANAVTTLWHDTYHTRLNYVAGPRWLNSNVYFYSKDHPVVFAEWDKKLNPSININDLKKKGAIFIWDAYVDEPLPESIHYQHPHLTQSFISQGLKQPVFKWDIRMSETLPESVKHEFPEISQSFILQFYWLRSTQALSPIKIGVAFLPPKKA